MIAQDQGNHNVIHALRLKPTEDEVGEASPDN